MQFLQETHYMYILHNIIEMVEARRKSNKHIILYDLKCICDYPTYIL